MWVTADCEESRGLLVGVRTSGLNLRDPDLRHGQKSSRGDSQGVKYFLSQRENFKLCWLPYAVLIQQAVTFYTLVVGRQSIGASLQGH